MSLEPDAGITVDAAWCVFGVATGCRLEKVCAVELKCRASHALV